MFLSSIFSHRRIWSKTSLQHAKDIVVGMTAGFTGGATEDVHENSLGARMAISEFNALGGLRGRRLRMVTLDDHASPTQAAVNAATLVTQRHAVALLLSRGTACTQAMVPVLEQHNVALVGPCSGAMVFHSPVNAQVFNVRISHQQEAANAVRYLHRRGMTRIALVHVDSLFGDESIAGAQKALLSLGIKPVLLAKFDQVRPDHRMLVKLILLSKPQALLFVGSAATLSGGIVALRAASLLLEVVTLSNNASATFAKLLRGHDDAVLVAQPFPSERDLVLPVTHDARKSARAVRLNELTHSRLEGYIAAKVLTLALCRLGPNVTSETVMTALNALDDFTVAGYAMRYSAANHSGFCGPELGSIEPRAAAAPVLNQRH